ncbi:hypothetical protein ACFL2Q_08855 [Thermodesulfobacteriota bacterium]
MSEAHSIGRRYFARLATGACLSIVLLISSPKSDAAERFGLAENALRHFRSVKYENMYTRVPTKGKLVSIEITDMGRTYYICKEKSGYVVYHLEIRPVEKLKDKLQKELKELSKKWDGKHPDELLMTHEKYDGELRNSVYKYTDAVWVRNEIVVGPQPNQSKKRKRTR